MGKKKVKRKAVKAAPRRRKAKAHVPTKKKSKRLNSKKKTSRKRRVTRKTVRKSPRSQSKTQLTGNSTKIKVDSRYAGSNVTILRKTTRLNPPMRIPRGPNGVRLLKKILIAPGIRHFKTIGKSKKDLFYIRLQYVFKYKSKNVVSYFSIGIARLKNAAQFQEFISDVIESFSTSLQGYSKDGFQDIRLTALVVQGYKK